VGSLARAGFAAWAVDLFADRDLKRIAPVVRCPSDRYPHALPELCDAFPPGPVLYTGGLENHPRVVAELAARRPLWGNPPDVLERVRDPFQLHDVLTAVGLPVPRLVPPGEPAPESGSWLCKPLRGAGGHGIRYATPGDAPPPTRYLQEFINGPPMSALFVTKLERVVLIGVTEQLVGEPWLHAAPFQYAGNVGPVLTPQLHVALERMADVLAAAAGLRGIWGIDFILQNDTPYPVELNPRYTAGVEALEHGTGVNCLLVHANCFPTPDPDRMKTWQHFRAIVGKAIYFAPHRLTFPTSGPWDADLTGEFDPWRVPGFADIPEPGEVIEPGWPVLTFFATGSTPDEVRGRLQSRAAELDTLFSRDAERRNP
jgi:predicted ATP-grasp superfamily ATP-dependent carboligase